MQIKGGWSEVRSLMRTRRLVEVISEVRGVRVQVVRRGGRPQTLCVPHEAGPVPPNMRDATRELRQAIQPRTLPVIDRATLFNHGDDDAIKGSLFATDDEED